MKKPKIPAITFVKGVSAMGVVCCHFFTPLTNIDIYHRYHVLNYANGYWGGVWVQVFLMVSGFLLHYHYSDSLDLKRYAVKRWRGIYPMFYIAYLFFMYGKICDWRSVFYYGHPWSYLLTVLGMDGYLMGRLPAYYIIGEWFLGVIIILYILYPLLRLAFRKNDLLAFLGTLVLYILFLDKPITNDNGLWTVSSCMVSFALGMLACCHRKVFFSKWTVGAAAVLCLVLWRQEFPFPSNLGIHLMGTGMFIVLFALGEKLMAIRPAGWFFGLLGDLSYPVFLVHNQIIPRIVGSWNPGNPLKCWLLFALVCLLSLTAGKALEVVTRAVMAWFDDKLAWLKQKKKISRSA